MAQFKTLAARTHYDIIDAESGDWIAQGVQGVDALNRDWPAGAEAWPAGEEEFNGSPIETAE